MTRYFHSNNAVNYQGNDHWVGLWTLSLGQDSINYLAQYATSLTGGSQLCFGSIDINDVLEHMSDSHEMFGECETPSANAQSI